MSEMIDRVERAMMKATRSRDNEPDNIARAIIEAMRVPTPEMLLAAQQQPGQQTYENIWQAMIDAALK
jgi:hypothetical protein